MIKFNPGDIISANTPFVHILDFTKKANFCDYCATKSDSLRKCYDCKQMHYCDKTCQKIDWKKHKFECSIYKQSYSEISGDLDRFLLRLYLFIQNNPTLKKKKETLLYDKQVERSFNDLMTHMENIKSDKNRMSNFYKLVERYNLCGIDFDGEVLFEYFCKICINSFSILDVQLISIGSGLYIAESVFDHSCEPNATTIYSGIDLEVRAIKPITKEEKITINYFDMKESKSIRQEKLLTGYYFNCKCQRCSNENPSDSIDCNQVIKLNNQMDEYVYSKSNWVKAYQIGLETMPLYEKIYGDYHPDLTVQLVRILKLRLYISSDLDNEAIQLISRVRKHISITHGYNNELFKMFQEIINAEN
ncbi:hypothetical protein RDWZM_001082 [Blomia tropicalis]|uniref:Uncharacterized protein n=1 Tax=Blomia tropicalis TaxID=40697 RepID=A0A9Q0MDK8_BLOTA|nr:hypothetical protein RDWZM_001082 [Blomia tropicalis]